MKQAYYYKGTYGHRMVAVQGDDVPAMFNDKKERWVCECGSTGTFGTKPHARLREDHAQHVERVTNGNT